MPRYQKTMKDVAACDKPRRDGKQSMNRGFPNGETQYCEPILHIASLRSVRDNPLN